MILFIFGLIVGSFLNVVIYRVPRGESIVLPPSHCPNCNHRLKWLDLFPVLSFLYLKGRCRYCNAVIGLRYPLVELLTAFLSVLTWWRFGWSLDFGVYLVFVYVLIGIALIDFDHQIIPNCLSYPTIVIGTIFSIFQGRLGEALVGGIIAGGLLLLVALIYPKGMGMGDVKYLALVGVFLGLEKALYVLFLGSVFGVLIIMPMMLMKRFVRSQPFAFGPFLVIATLVIMFCDPLIAWIHRLYQ